MNRFPLEMIEKVFEYLPLMEVIKFDQLNDRFEAAATQQLKQRCVNIKTATYRSLRKSSVDATFNRIRPYIRHITVDGLYYRCWIPEIINSCPNVESLTIESSLHREYPSNVSNVKTLTFFRIQYYEHMIKEFLLDRFPNLETLVFDRANVTGSFLAAVPNSVRTLRFLNTRIELQCVLDYMRVNPNLEDLRIQARGTIEPRVLLRNLQNVRTLGLIGERLIRNGFEQFANLSNLVRLDLQVTSADFCNYPEAINAETQQLQELNIALSSCLIVDNRFAKSFRKFQHVTKMTIYIGVYVAHFHLMLPHLNYLGKCGKLETLILAGCTDELGLDEHKSQLQHIKKLRICHPSDCKCKDHSILFFSVKEHLMEFYKGMNHNDFEWY